MTGVLVAALLLAAPAPGAPPSWVPEAIRLGSTPVKLPAYTVPELAVEYTTPFLRVVRASNKAFREGKMLRPAEVDPRAWVPELRVAVGPRPPASPGRAPAAPKSARLILGAGEARATRMEADAQGLRAVFEVPGAAPAGAELEIRYTAAGKEIVERVPLDFRKTRW